MLCLKASLNCKAPAWSGPGALSTMFYKSIHDECCKPIMPSLLPDKSETIAEVCEECITHTELNVHQYNLKINFLLFSRNFLPVGVAYKTTNNHSFSSYSAFSRQSSNFFQNIKLEMMVALLLLTMIPMKQIVTRFG